MKAAGKNQVKLMAEVGFDPDGFGESGERWSSTVCSVRGNL